MGAKNGASMIFFGTKETPRQAAGRATWLATRGVTEPETSHEKGRQREHRLSLDDDAYMDVRVTSPTSKRIIATTSPTKLQPTL